MATVTTTTTTVTPGLGLTIDKGYIHTKYGKFNLALLVITMLIFLNHRILIYSDYFQRLSTQFVSFVLLHNHGHRTFLPKDGFTSFVSQDFGHP